MKSAQMYKPKSKIVPQLKICQNSTFSFFYAADISFQFKSGILIISSICAKKKETLPSAEEMVVVQWLVLSVFPKLDSVLINAREQSFIFYIITMK